MKGLRRFIAPFAPDQSGAAAVLCELGGMVVILDAGGCAGNICGFDEPRWFGSRSAIFSAGLRDMDAILGRDDLLVQKIDKAAKRIRAAFIALIGTPVPAVIATDYRALRRMITKKTGLPVLIMDSKGTGLYDSGAGKAWLELVKNYAEPHEDSEAEDHARPDQGYPGCGQPVHIGVFGLTPLDLGMETEVSVTCFQGKVTSWLEENGEVLPSEPGSLRIHCYGMGSSLEELRQAGVNRLNIAASPSGLAAVRYMEDQWGTPWIPWCPPDLMEEGREVLGPESLEKIGRKKNILIVHQQLLGNSLRQLIEQKTGGPDGPAVTVASWFMMDEDLMRQGDYSVREEDQWQEIVYGNAYDLIIGDSLFAMALPDYKGDWVSLSHFAVSGKRAGL